MLAGPVVSYTAVMVGATPSFVVGNPTCRTGGGATDLTRFIHIAYSSLWEMFQGCVIFDRRILVARVNGTSNTTTTDVLRLDSTERQRSFQNRLHRRNGS